MRARRRGREEWRRLLAASEGETNAELARRLGVHAVTVGSWRRRLAGTETPGEPALAKIVEVRAVPLPMTDPRFEVRLAGGRSVVVPPAFDAAALERLVRALEASS